MALAVGDVTNLVLGLAAIIVAIAAIIFTRNQYLRQSNTHDEENIPLRLHPRQYNGTLQEAVGDLFESMVRLMHLSQRMSRED